MLGSELKFQRRSKRVRYKLKTVGNGSPRLSVFRSGRHVYAQIIDDSKSVTLCSASTLDKEVVAGLKGGKTSGKDAALVVGKFVAERALKAGIKNVVFDRGGFAYIGKIACLADSARKSGLSF